ncbi:bacillithiol system redox-active protein YtxJ [Leptobacterium flavescens]|uniref:Bacillithiol system redox-active protein YtxJ n=1 Tax=Leptobacterium flavescens TaxID=472055 RepID=A0A6P0ULE9_9FLAO|nr:bacillithiol system redox-active protein YtxJ [Leptobacterium flavescens]NER13342.1 bacillithiol system redox-active protein YtxJ [Leptobacterium flavescens]
MGFFNRLLGGNNENNDSNIDWAALNDVAQIDEIVQESKKQTVAIFKHSTRCGISRMVLSGFERDYDYNGEEIKMYFLDILNFRNISNEIANRFNVWHESPQLLVFRDGKIIYHTSHGNIEAGKLNEFIK